MNNFNELKIDELKLINTLLEEKLEKEKEELRLLQNYLRLLEKRDKEELI